MTVDYAIIGKEQSGQRLDNYLIRKLKGVPKSRIYRAIRAGEVRVNRKRARADTRLNLGDKVRIPPIRTSGEKKTVVVTESLQQCLESRVLIENTDYLIIDKPAGIPVHGGSHVNLGMIEALRQLRPQAKFLELVHRLDRETSGLLMIAKRRSVLLQLQEWLKSKQMKKRYWVLVRGQWQEGVKRCDAPLLKNQLQSGERVVRVDRHGKQAITVFRPLQIFDDCSLLEATLKTGRTHQIRVHLRYLGFPIAGDEKYGDRAFNRAMKARGLKRMFLHAAELMYRDHEHRFGVCVRLDESLQTVLDHTDNAGNKTI